jgi:hypothetical protein
MTGAGPPSLPGSRDLARWWQELAPRQPQRLWLSRLPLHRIEALVEVVCSCPLDRLQLALLAHLCRVSPSHPIPLETLHLERSLLLHYLRDLARRGLVEEGADGWRPTAAGRDTSTGTPRCRLRERRGFYFVDNAEWQGPPHFLHLAHGRPQPAAVPANWSFDPRLLQRGIAQETAWKQRLHFPAEVSALVDTGATGGDWRAVVLDFPEQIMLALVEVPGPGLLGFAVDAPAWHLEARTPAVEMRDGWDEVFPDLARQPGADDWQAAWQDWCQPLDLPADEVAACRVQQVGHRLRVVAPAQLVGRFQGGRPGEALTQEEWVLAGSGRSREAAHIELVEDRTGP